jgi:hypothetical protein
MYFRTYVDFHQATRRHIPGDSTAHSRHCEIQQFSVYSLCHAPVLLTFPVVAVVTNAHKIYDTDRNFALAENRD